MLGGDAGKAGALKTGGTAKPRRVVAPVFAALGDETRLLVLARLQAGGERSLSQLADGMAVSRQAVAKHVRVLEGARLVRCRREGRETLVTLRPERLGEAAAYLERISAQWDEALGRLKAFVEQ